MDVYRSEEEQIEAIQRWWKDNGKSLLSGICVVLVIWFGWTYWDKQQKTTAEAASDIYHDLMESVELLTSATDDKKENQTATATHLAETLKNDFGATAYAQYAALFMAKLAVEANQLDSAANELKWVLDHNPSENMKLLTTLRLSRVIYAQGKAEDALALIEKVDAGTLQTSYEEAKGDIYLGLGRADEARQAYNKAKGLVIGEPRGQTVLDMKVNDLMKPKEFIPKELSEQEPDLKESSPAVAGE